MKDWREWLQELEQELHGIFHHLDMYKKLKQIVTENEKLKQMDGTVLDWMNKAFIVDLVIAIGRLCDTTKDTRSLAKFLSMVKKNKDLLARKRYISLYEGSSRKEWANRDFDKLSQEKDLASYPEKIIDKDIKKLTGKDPCKKIVDFRHKYIAHIAGTRGELPTYQELYNAFEVIEDIMRRYRQLLTGDYRDSYTPIMLGNWKEPFTIPWIDKVAKSIS